MIRRESSDFLRQKQKQWEREKAESESRSEWFPFGENLTPGGGSPLRKFAPKEPVDQEQQHQSTEIAMSMQSSSMNSTLNNPEQERQEHRQTGMTSSETPEKQQSAQVQPDTQQHHHSAPHYAPFPMYALPVHPHQLAAFQQQHHQQQMMIHQGNAQNPQESMENEEKGSTGNSTNTTQTPHFFAPQYQVIPAGAIPVSTISIDPSQICPIDQLGMWAMPPPTGPNGMRYGIPIPAPFVPQIMTSSTTSSASATASGAAHLNFYQNQQQQQQLIQNAIMTSSATDSSSESGVSGVKDDISEEKIEKKLKKHGDEERQSTSDYTDDDPIPLLTRRNTSTSAASSLLGCNYQEQIAERRRFEAEEEHRERLELLEVERQRRILDDRRRDEEEKRKRMERDRVEEDRRRADQFAAAMEAARKEAELLKKAKLYKHVLRGAEEEGGREHFDELEQKILGVDSQTGRRLLKEVSDVEWHKKQDEVEISKKAAPKEQHNNNTSRSSADSTQHQHRPRSTSIIATSSSSPAAAPNNSPFFGRNGFGRRSVRTTSREKQEVTVVDADKPLGEQLNGTSARGGSSISMRRSDPPRRAAPPPPTSPVSSLPRHQHHLQNFANSSVQQHQQQQYPRVAQSSHSTASAASSNTPEQHGEGEMLKSANFYCPINREPLSVREESRAASYKPTTPQKYDQEWARHGGVGGRHNDITQSALFGPVSTRLSTRRGQMRGIGMQSPPSVRCPPPAQRTSSFEESSSGGEDTGSLSPDLSHKNFESPLPSSTENVHPAPNSPPLASKNEKNAENGGYEYGKTFRTRSALGSPMSMLNGGDSPVINRCASPSASRLMQRLELKGHIRRDDEHISQDVRRLAETNLSRSPSMASLRGSIQNLSIRGSHLNLASNSGEPSPNLSKFASVNSPARQSLTSLRKTTDRQAAVLERLGRLRESLHAGKNFTPPRATPSSRIATPAQTPPISPRPVL